MPAVANHAKRQLLEGKLAIGLGLRQARTVDIAQLFKTAGFDWLFIDCEHGSMDIDTAAQIWWRRSRRDHARGAGSGG